MTSRQRPRVTYPSRRETWPRERPHRRRRRACDRTGPPGSEVTLRYQPVAAGVARCVLIPQPQQMSAVNRGNEAATEEGDVDGGWHRAIIVYAGVALYADAPPRPLRRVTRSGPTPAAPSPAADCVIPPRPEYNEPASGRSLRIAKSDSADYAGRRPHLRGRRGGDREQALLQPAVRTGARAPGSARAPSPASSIATRAVDRRPPSSRTVG